MNIGEIKRLFDEYAKKIPARAELEEVGRARKSGPVEGPLLIVKNFALEGQHADDYYRCSEAINRVAKKDGTWSKSSIGSLLTQCVAEVIDASPEARSDAIRAQSKALVESLKGPLIEWIVDLQVAGLKPDCRGVRFGQIEFFVDRVKSNGIHECGRER